MVSNTLGLESTQDTVPHFIHSFIPPKQVESFCLLKNVAIFLRPSAKHAASQTPFSVSQVVLLTLFFVLTFCWFHTDVQYSLGAS